MCVHVVRVIHSTALTLDLVTGGLGSGPGSNIGFVCWEIQRIDLNPHFIQNKSKQGLSLDMKEKNNVEVSGSDSVLLH